MSGNSINFGSGGGTYNENIHLHGGDYVQGDKNVNQDLNQIIVEIQKLLYEFQGQYSVAEAQEKAATELARQATRNPETRNGLVKLGKYVAVNGGIEAGIGKVIELALKLVGI